MYAASIHVQSATKGGYGLHQASEAAGVGLHLPHTLYSNVRPLDRAFTRLQARLGSCCACAALHACMHAFAHTLQLNLAMLPRALTLAHGASPRPHGKGANLAYMVPSALTRVG